MIILGFDWIWRYLPSLSGYQIWIVVISGYVATIGGYTAVFPVFAQYDQPSRCQNQLDESAFGQYNLTFTEVVEIMDSFQQSTNETKQLCQYVDADYKTCTNHSDRNLFINCTKGDGSKTPIVPQCHCDSGHQSALAAPFSRNSI